MLTLATQTLAITAGTVLCALVPFAFGAKRALPRGLLPLATGTMTGLCFFGLLPEAGKEGGALSLGLAILVALIYSLIHLKHLHHHASPVAEEELVHGHDGHTHAHGNGIEDDFGTHVHGDPKRPLGILATAIFVHSLLDGSLLVISTGLFGQAVASVTISLGIHKAFEALSLASLVYWRIRDRKQAARWLTAYVLSFPCGVLLTAWVQQAFSTEIMERLALLTMSVAIGNLVGCLIFDFVLPSVGRFKQHKDEVYWMLGGMAAASIVLWEL